MNENAAGNGVGSETNAKATAGKNGSNGRANSLRMMGKSTESSNEEPSVSLLMRWKMAWDEFKVQRESYSLWIYPLDSKYDWNNNKRIYTLIRRRKYKKP